MMLVALARHPTVLRKLQSELDATIPSSARLDINQFPSSATIRSLPYLSGCINEAMRLFPVGGAGSKRITVSEIEYEGVVIPKGSTCVLAVHSMYRQPWIERVDEFLPERWETSNPQEKELRAMFMPFAHGGRNCIGQNLAKVELWLISAYLLRFFEFELLSEPSYQIFLTMKATNVRVKVHSRQ
jgi:cytochrome P450